VTVYNRFFAYKPNAAEYGRFMTAIATRYSGHYTPPGESSPLPKVNFWAIYNEPNFGEDLGPQALGGSKVPYAPMLYRKILNAGWKALQTTGHGHDTILVGGYAARGIQGGKFPGNYSQTKPLLFIRDLYCVNKSYRQLGGKLAKQMGCPTSRSAVKKFRSQNPALFSATGVADHPYPVAGSPLSDGRGEADFATFPDLGNLARTMDKVTRHYGSHKKFPIYNDEYGYITHPPNTGNYVSPTTAAYYINWAEYLSWRSSRIASTMQYPLEDPAARPGLPEAGGFASGLETAHGIKKPAFDAYRLPLYLPVTSTLKGRSLEIWGGVRPAHYIQTDTGSTQTVQIQFQHGSHGSFSTVKTLSVTDPRGYFDLHSSLPGSGSVRLAWTYPSTDPFLPTNALGVTVYSRTQKVNLR
jgi:hypothetical protein